MRTGEGAEQADAADEGWLEPSGGIMVGKTIANQGKLVRPSQLIRSVRPTWRGKRGSQMKLGAWQTGIALAAVAAALAPVVRGQNAPRTDNAELARMFQEDQDDRKPGLHGIDWAVVKPRDDARLARARELYAAGALRTGADWWHAALILQHSSEAGDYLLAHEMSVAAVVRGEENAKWLVAATEDRFLMKIGHKQRFGTQYEPGDEPGKYRLAATDPQVTDELRAVLNVPSLAEAKAAASQFDKK